MDVTTTTAADLIRRAQVDSGLSMSDLARRCGVARTQLQHYVAGTKEPSWSNLTRVLAGAGVSLSTSSPRPSAALARHREALVAAGRAHGLTRGTLFGSTARGEDRVGSDLDILVEGAMDTMDLRVAATDLGEELSALLDVRVDVVAAPAALGSVVRAARREGVVLWS